MAATYALSDEQAHVWSLGTPDRVRVQAWARREGALGLEAVTAAAARLVRQHEILRTTYAVPAGRRVARQTVHDDLAPAVRADDRQLEDVLATERDAPWDLATESPLRVVVVADAVVVTLPALAADAVAAGDVAAAIVAALTGAGDAAHDDPLQYADYAAWQQDVREDPAAAEGRAAWAARSAPYPLHLPFEQPFDPRTVPLPRSRGVDVDLAAARRVGAQYGRDAATVVAAAWYAYVARVGDEPTVGIAAWFSGRDHEETIGAIGALGRYGEVAIDTGDDRAFAEIVDAVGRAFEWGAAHADDLVPIDASGDPRERVTLAFSSLPRRADGATDRFAAEVRVDDEGVRLLYDAAALDDDAAARVAAQLSALLADALHAPDAAIAHLRLVGGDEQERVVALGRGRSRPLPTETVLRAFERCAATWPARPAVTDGTQTLTYAELDGIATAIGTQLTAAGVAAGDAVGLCTDRSVHMLAALLGIWKSGAAYVPLNFEHPVGRLAHQLEESGAGIVVTQRSVRDNLPPTAIAIEIDDVAATDGAPGRADLDGLAYVMYTSGSTGLPKGVEVGHANLAAYADAVVERLALDAADTPLRCATVTAISTDLGNTTIFPPLTAGHTVVLVAPEVAMDPVAFAELSDAGPIDVLKITPSHLDALLSGGPHRVLPRHTLVLGGEASSWELVGVVHGAGACRIVNHYGPTETTVGCCTYDVTATRPASAPRTVPIGTPIANARAYVVDARGAPVPVGVPGELWIGGAGVARGYANRPDETAARFVAEPFGEGGRVYRTGDRVRWLPEGVLEFLGRVDDQVKIRGFRIEPREVEQVLLGHPQVRHVAVVPREDAPGDRRLVAYIVADGAPTSAALRAAVAASLPDYMAPSAYVLLGALPLTASGKVDRRALPAPEDEDLGRPHVAARSETEARLVELWCEVLHRERVGVEDDFFELGGHSLLAAQIVARVRGAFGVELPLHSVFTAPTVALLATEVDQLSGGDHDDEVDDLLGDLANLSDEEIERLLGEG